jgi:hypothetical protein
MLVKFKASNLGSDSKDLKLDDIFEVGYVRKSNIVVLERSERKRKAKLNENQQISGRR